MAKGQYIRVYHELRDEYPGVWRSDAQLALFVRLLLIAEKWWPQWAPVDHRNGAYRSLVECGLVLENQGGNGYTIKGLGPERSRRSQHGRHAASIRWASSEHAQPMPRREEKEKKKTNGQSPNDRETFMGFPPKPGLHDGSHPDCAVCAPLRKAAGT